MAAAFLILVDSGLVSDVGHHYRTTRLFAEAARRAGYSIVVCTPRVYAHLPASIGEVIHLPCLTTTLYDDAPETNARKIEEMPGEIIRGLRDAGVSADALDARSFFFFHTATQVQTAIAVRLCDMLPGPGRKVRLLLRYEPGLYPERLRPTPPDFIDGIRRSVESGRLELFAETDDLAAAHSEYSGAPCGYLPHVAISTHGIAAMRSADQAPMIGCLGEARLAKGFDLLPEAIGRTLAAADVPPCRFLVQITTRVAPPPPVEAACDRLRALRDRSPARVTLIEEPLSDDAYDECVAACDAFLLPYDHQRYRRRGSGIVVDALLSGKPFVAPAGTWMASRASCGNGVAWPPGEDLAPALARLISEMPALRRRAIDIAPLARQHHDADTVFRVLTGNMTMRDIAEGLAQQQQPAC